MKDGYFYFIPASAGKNEHDKSLGYICISQSPGRNGYAIQCSLNKERIIKLSNARRPIEIYLSPVTYITNGSFSIGKFALGQKGRLFIDSFLPLSIAESFDENQYIIITAGERTVYYSEVYRKEISAKQEPLQEVVHDSMQAATQYSAQDSSQKSMKETAQISASQNISHTSVQNASKFKQPARPDASSSKNNSKSETVTKLETSVQSETTAGTAKSETTAGLETTARFEPSGREFDPFNTINSSYKWYVHESYTDTDNSINAIGDLEKLLCKLNVQHELFAKMDLPRGTVFSDTFLKTAYRALQVAGHILRGEYTDPQSSRCFTVIGLPGLNIRNPINSRNGRRPSLSPASIRIYARWHTASRKINNSYNRNYNGYWLYYFDSESGAPVKAVMKNS